MRVEDVVELLRRTREEEGLTQEGVATRVGWKRQQVAAYESGAKEPGLASLQRWASALGIPCDLVIGQITTPEPSLARAVAMLAKGWEAATPDERRSLEVTIGRWAR